MSTRPDISPRRHWQAGISLIELVMFIVIVSVGVVGILSVMTLTTAASADPLERKQAVAIAEALMEEIQQQPFTICDPVDPAAETGAACAITEVAGPETTSAGTQTRYSATSPFNNVNDYSGFSMPIGGIRGLDNVLIAGLEKYGTTVTITDDPIGGLAAGQSLRIEVRVQTASGVDITLTGYRLRYAPYYAS